jgi:hypothetical protein
VRLYGSGGASEGRRRLSLGEVGEVSQHDYLTLTARKSSQRLHQVPAFGHVLIENPDRSYWELGEAATLSVSIDGEVGGDSAHPTLGVLMECRPPEKGSRHRLLGDIFGVSSVAQDPKRHPESEPVEAFEGQLERPGWTRISHRISLILHGIFASGALGIIRPQYCHGQHLTHITTGLADPLAG